MAWSQGRKAFEQAVRQALRGSVSFYDTSGEINMYQAKPDMKATGAAGITAFEVSPRFSSGVAGSKLVGFYSNPILKGSGAAGDLTSDMRCYEAKLEVDTGSTRTVAGTAACLHCMSGMHGTVTGGVYPLYVSAAGGGTDWSGLMKLPDDGGSIADLASAVSTVNTVVKCRVGATTTYLVGYGTYTPT